MGKRDKPDEWMPLYVGAYLRKTTHLTIEQHGAYLLLLMTYWVQQAPLPDDDMQLSAIVKVSQKKWKTSLRPVLEKFFRVGDGMWVQERAQSEINRAVEISEIRSIAGKTGGKASAATRTKPQANGQANVQPNAEQNGKQTAKQNPTPLPLHLNSSAAELYDPRARLLKLFEVLRVSPATDAGVIVRWPEELAALIADGLDFERHILPSAIQAVSRGTRVKSLNYLRGHAAELRAGEEAEAGLSQQEMRKERLEWLKAYVFDGRWHAIVGPAPHEPGTLVTDEEFDLVKGSRQMRDKLQKVPA